MIGCIVTEHLKYIMQWLLRKPSSHNVAIKLFNELDNLNISEHNHIMVAK
jgi:hypothetical protein